jgi:hypothetical protein
MLEERGLAGARLSNSDIPAAALTGLHLMNILADCCAGNSMARITDRQGAYDLLAGLLAEKTNQVETTQLQPDDSRQAVVKLTLDVLDLSSVCTETLIRLRELEVKETTGWKYRDLRHRYVDRIEDQLKKLRMATGDAERNAIREEFKESMKDDLQSLREALGTNVFQTGATYAGIVATALVGAYEAVKYLAGWGPPPLQT